MDQSHKDVDQWPFSDVHQLWLAMCFYDGRHRLMR